MIGIVTLSVSTLSSVWLNVVTMSVSVGMSCVIMLEHHYAVCHYDECRSD